LGSQVACGFSASATLLQVFAQQVPFHYNLVIDNFQAVEVHPTELLFRATC